MYMTEEEMQKIRDVIEAARFFKQDIVRDSWDCSFCNEVVEYMDDDERFLVHRINCPTLILQEAFRKM